MKNNQIAYWVPDHIRVKIDSINDRLLGKESRILSRLVTDPRMEKVYWALKDYSEVAQHRFILYAMSSARDLERFRSPPCLEKFNKSFCVAQHNVLDHDARSLTMAWSLGGGPE